MKRKCGACRWFIKVNRGKDLPKGICEAFDTSVNSGDAATNCKEFKSKKYRRVKNENEM